MLIQNRASPLAHLPSFLNLNFFWRSVKVSTFWVETQGYERKAQALYIDFTYLKTLCGCLHNTSAAEKEELK